jgi:replicative DNA helicase
MVGRNGRGRHDKAADVIPSDVGAEQALVASILADVEEAKATCLDLIRPEIFSDPGFRDLTKRIQEWTHEGREIDPILLSGAIPETLGGERFVELCTDVVPSAARTVEYFQRVEEVWKLKEYWFACFNAMQRSIKPNATSAQVRIGLEKMIEKIESKGRMPSVFSSSDLMDKTMEQIRPAEERLGGQAIHTNINALDEMLMGGFHPAQLYILAARPSMGKTTLGLNIATNIAAQQKPVMFISLESRCESILTAVLSRCARVNSRHLIQGHYSKEARERLQAASQKVGEIPLFLCDQTLVTLGCLRTMCRQAVMNYGVELFVIDYLQLLEPDSKAENRQVQVSTMSRGVKLLAGELGVPFVLVSQLSRALESRDDKRPRLSDLRESGSIEQDADAVLLMYRPGYYHRSGDPSLTEVRVAKQRHGPVGTVKMRFEAEFNNFKEW